MTGLLVDEKNRQLELAADARDRVEREARTVQTTVEVHIGDDAAFAELPRILAENNSKLLAELDRQQLLNTRDLDDDDRYLWRDQRSTRRGDPEYVWMNMLAQRMLCVMLGLIALALIGKAIVEIRGGAH